jgi:hypothetical protein
MDKKEAFDFYKLIRGEEISWLNLHRQYSQQYLTLISAIFAVSLGALYQFKNEPLLVVAVILGPLLNILLGITAIKMCNRFYQRFLEGVTIQAKIEPLLGLDTQREENQEDDTRYPFPDDKHYLPNRWLESRKQNSSLDFVNDHMKSGSNKYVQLSFKLLLVANIVVIIGIIVSSILQLFQII